MKISEKIKLPCGVSLSNRLVKAAMSENMATPDHYPEENFFNAYKFWVEGGTGLLITGNVMVDSNHRGEPFNVVIEKGLENHDHLRAWADTAKDHDTQIWIQLNHPGKQSPKFLTKNPVGPSAIPLKPPLNNMFNDCRELKHNEILDIVDRFSYAAKICKEVGFSGVQIHGAHGYLISQFLSPHHNQRTDEWGGSLKNRMKFVLEIYKDIRKEVGESFPVGIKINSADFSKGGFAPEDAVEVAKTLSEIGIDMIELSGGTYEKPAMMGDEIKSSTKKREAYFLEYAKAIKDVISCPLMVTGGFRSLNFMENSLKNNELDLIGLARPLALNPQLSKQFLSGERVESKVRPISSGFKLIDKLLPVDLLWYSMQIRRMGNGKPPHPKLGVFSTLIKTIFEMGLQNFKKVRGI